MGFRTLTRSKKRMELQMRSYLLAVVVVFDITFKGSLATGNARRYEEAHFSGTKFESPNNYGIGFYEKLFCELIYGAVCAKREFSDGWIFNLAGKLVRKR